MPAIRCTGPVSFAVAWNVLLMVLLTACSAELEGSAPGAEANAAPVANRSALRPAAATERERIRQHFAQRRAKLNVVATTVTSDGTEFDWIPRPTHYADGRPIVEPPARPRRGGAPSPGYETSRAKAELELHPEAQGPAGTVPVLRQDTEAFIGKLDASTTLKQILSKTMPGDARRRGANPLAGEEPPAPNAHLYADTTLYTENLVTIGEINVWNPSVYKSAEFSLGQTAVIAYATFCFFTCVENVMQTVEAGWQDYPQKYGTSQPHFFVFYSTNGHTSSGDNVGGYNMDFDGFVQYDTTISPGQTIGSHSVQGGTQVEIDVEVAFFFGAWWVRFNDRWVGYYPASLYSASGAFTGGLSQGFAERISWYGETVDLDSDMVRTRTDMGSARHANTGFTQAAYMKNLITHASNGTVFDVSERYVAGSTSTPTPGCYSLQAHFNNTVVGGFGSYFYWGGPGYDASTCP
jgi:hypothetical protein